MVEARDSKGHFIKGNVPWNRRLDTQSGIVFTYYIIAQIALLSE
jgi:hypothetical protein